MSLPLRCALFIWVSSLLVLCSSEIPAQAQNTFYVAPNGNDNNPGSEFQPFQTIEKARDVVRTINKNMTSDIVVYLHGGNYVLTETLVFGQEDSGTNGFHVIYKAYPGEKPIISGGQKITGWVAAENGIYKALVGPLRFRQLYVNGRRAIRARDPNKGNYYRLKYWDVPNLQIEIVASSPGTWEKLGEVEMIVQKHWYQNNLRINSYTVDAKWYKALLRWGLPGNFLSSATLNLFTAWILQLQRILSVDLGVRARVVPAEPERRLSFLQTFPQRENGQSYHFENAREFLDEPGEWYLDTGRNALLYRPRLGEDMNVVDVIAPRLETLVKLQGSLGRPIWNIQLVGLIFKHTTWLAPSDEGFVGDQAVVTFTQRQPTEDERNYYVGGRLPGAIHIEVAHNVRLERNIFRHLGASAVVLAFGTQGNEIVGNVVTDGSGSGIVVDQYLEGNPRDPRMICQYDKIANNYISEVGQDYYGSVGIFAGYTDGIVIEHNEIKRLPYTAISVGWGWSLKDTKLKNNVIRRNRIHNVMTQLDDGAGVYALSKQPGTLISENYIHDIKRSKWAGAWPIAGIYLDQGSDFITVTGNVLRNVESEIHLNFVSYPPAGTHNQFNNNDGESQDVIVNAGLQLDYEDIRSAVDLPNEPAPGH